MVAPLLPPPRPRPKGGRPPVDDRKALTGIQWQLLPTELGCGSGSTCWRRLRDWQRAGAWHALHRVLLDRLGEADRIDWSRACLDSASVPAKGGARRPARTPPIAASQAASATW